MKRPDFITAAQAAAMIADGSTVGNVSMTMTGTSCAVYDEIENRFLTTGHPRGITLFHTACFSDKTNGIERFAHKGLLKRVIGGHWGFALNLMKLIANGDIEAYNMPLGIISNMFHDMSARLPGSLSKIGLGTYLDPRIEGGAMNNVSKEKMVEVVDILGEEHLLYRSIPIDYIILRGTYADEDGNITACDEAVKLENLTGAMAAKRYGGKVIVQVKKIIKSETIPPREIEIPGVLVDAVVVSDNHETQHRQTYSWTQNDSCCGRIKVPVSEVQPAPLNERKVIVRRAVTALTENAIINAGTGIPNDVIGPILSEEGCSNIVTLTVESGTYGGITLGGADFGVAVNPVAIIPENIQFDLYDGHGVDFAFMGAGEIDADGNINVTKMGNMIPGCGGFVNITSTAKNVYFCSTFTGRGLKVSFDTDKGVTIVQEGSLIKFVKKVQQISYNSRYNTSRGQNAYYITERAVFKLTPEGPVLTEIAKGVDLERDILAHMEFVPQISDDLIITDTSLYSEGKFGLKEIILKNCKRWNPT